MNGWQDPLASQPEPELFPGSLIGYRQFRIPFVDGKNPECLRSLYHPFGFYSGSWHTARCAARSGVVEEHVTPSENCRCGFYVNYLPELRYDSLIGRGSEVRAVVECAGKIILATKGYRAARMRIRGLAAPPEYVEHLSLLFPRVVSVDDWDSLVEEFPRSDYDSLLGTSVREFALSSTMSINGQQPQIIFDLRVVLDNLTQSFDKFNESLKKTQLRSKDLCKSYAAFDLAQTERLFIQQKFRQESSGNPNSVDT